METESQETDEETRRKRKESHKIVNSLRAIERQKETECYKQSVLHGVGVREI